MATFSSRQAVRADSQAALISWVNLVHSAMLAVGCVQTADAGQLLESDIPVPVAGTNYVLGYRMYELNDSLSADFPVFIRVDFSPRRISNSSTAYAAPAGEVTVGFSTDGQGNIAQPALCGRRAFNSYTAASQQETYTEAPLSAACKLDGYLGVVIGVGCMVGTSYTTATAHLFFIIRSRNEAGEFTGDGAVVVFSDASDPRPTGHRQASYQWGWRDPARAGDIVEPAFGTPAISTAGGLVLGTPAVLNDGVKAIQEGLVLSVPIAGTTAGLTIQMSDDDQIDHTYLVIPASTANSDGAGKVCVIPDSRARYSHALAMRFE